MSVTMRTLTTFIAICAFCSLIIGCKSNVNSMADSNSRNDPVTSLRMPNPSTLERQPSISVNVHAIIFSATYMGSVENNDQNVRVLGRNFYTLNANQNDCLESMDNVTWIPCARVLYASGIEYDIVATQ